MGRVCVGSRRWARDGLELENLVRRIGENSLTQHVNGLWKDSTWGAITSI